MKKHQIKKSGLRLLVEGIAMGMEETEPIRSVTYVVTAVDANGNPEVANGKNGAYGSDFKEFSSLFDAREFAQQESDVTDKNHIIISIDDKGNEKVIDTVFPISSGDGTIHIFDRGPDFPYVERYIAMMPDGWLFFISHDGGVGVWDDPIDYTTKAEMEGLFDDDEHDIQAKEIDTFPPEVIRGLNLIVSNYYENDEPKKAEEIYELIPKA